MGGSGEGSNMHPDPAKSESMHYINIIENPPLLALLGESCTWLLFLVSSVQRRESIDRDPGRPNLGIFWPDSGSAWRVSGPYRTKTIISQEIPVGAPRRGQQCGPGSCQGATSVLQKHYRERPIVGTVGG
jgi:hypothetical protein